MTASTIVDRYPVEIPRKIFSLNFKMLYCMAKGLCARGHSKSILSMSKFVKKSSVSYQTIDTIFEGKKIPNIHTLWLTHRRASVPDTLCVFSHLQVGLTIKT